MTTSDQPTKPKKDKNPFKATLNLPKTSFPMRANLVQNEPASLKRWDKMKMYDATRDLRSDTTNTANRGAWAFHDGPPYANGSIHLGHLLNKVLKDFVVRSRTMMGYDVPYVPGWDCHGLPIEHKVMSELVESGKMDKLNSLDDDARRMAVRRECKKSAEKFIKLQKKQMQRLLTTADYDNPYLTMVPEYEAGVLEVFSLMVSRGVVYRDLKPVHWSIDNQTALAEAELEYYDRDDTSVFVWFDVEDTDSLAKLFGVDSDVCNNAAFMIWTTTPWTLPANLAVAVHPRFEYVLVNLNGRPTVMAKELANTVVQTAGGEPLPESAFLGSCKGEKLTSVTYRHPFCDRTSPVVTAEYVTLEDGTGLVHTAPGHGVDDYQTGLREGLKIYCPVLADGTFDTTAPEWLQGKSVWDGNSLVVEHLRSSGNLYHDYSFSHSYPHDWRGKSPVIFRATEQWFVDVNKPFGEEQLSLRERALNETKNDVAFHPEWGRNRMRGMLDTRPDWCLSRQRSWGLPIPAFYHGRNHKEYLLTQQSVMAVAHNIQKHGSDYWFTSTPTELLEGYDAAADADAPDWFKQAFKDANNALADTPLEKAHDIFDVWFESGSSWNPVMRGRKMGYPVELYLEGSDQHRGWFQLSLLCGLSATGQSPFKTLLTHGFTVDRDGHKMSKSLGNTLEVEDLLKNYGADVCRWWVASQNFDNDMKAGLELFDVAGESYRKIRNTLRFLLSNLQGFDVHTEIDQATGQCAALEANLVPTSLDAWVLGEYDKLANAVLEAYTSYEFRDAQNAIYNFCNDTLSAVYCAATKDRLYCDPTTGARRQQTQRTMWLVCNGLARLLAPLLPHTADETYRVLWSVDAKDTSACVHLTEFVNTLAPVEPDESWPAVMKAREAGLLALEQARSQGTVENPLDAEVRVADCDQVLTNFATRAEGDTFAIDFADLLGVSRVSFAPDAESCNVRSLVDEPRCERSWKRDGTVKKRSDGNMLSDRDAHAVGVD